MKFPKPALQGAAPIATNGGATVRGSPNALAGPVTHRTTVRRAKGFGSFAGTDLQKTK